MGNNESMGCKESMGSRESNEGFVIAYADKTVLKIKNLHVKSLNTNQLENLLAARLGCTVRVIGVTSQSLDLDIYGLDEEGLLKDEAGIIKAISLAEGITGAEVAKISEAHKIVSADFDEIPVRVAGCAKERWLVRSP